MFISYAQNLEDVMLWRALKHIKQGFYIDVGANDPVLDSVTKHFYEQGWHGINIEPLQQHFLDLLKQRPHDINLKLAVGARAGHLRLWEADVRGWATADSAVIKMHEADGHNGQLHTVEMETLENICERYAESDIHFLKIDVEGLESEVLRGANFRRFRPWIVVIEATLPNSTTESYLEWESLITTHAYDFAYADGLNRYYLATEKSELASLLRYPPNVFDEYQRYEHISLAERTHGLEVQLRQVKAETKDSLSLERVIQGSVDKLSNLESRLDQAAENIRLSMVRDAANRAQVEDMYLRLIASEKQQLAIQQDSNTYKLQREEAIRQFKFTKTGLNEALHLLRNSEQLNTQHLNQIEVVQKELHEVHQANHYHWLQLESSKAELERIKQNVYQQAILIYQRELEIHALKGSRSWLLTAPVRWVSNQGRLLSEQGLNRRVKAAFLKLFIKPFKSIDSRLKASKIAKSFFRNCGSPAQYKYLYNQVNPDFTVAKHPLLVVVPVGNYPINSIFSNLSDEDLSERTKEFYLDLKGLIDMKSEGNT